MDSDKKREQTRLRVERYREKQAALPAFDDLPIDVQLSIDRISDSPEEKARRTAVALGYQRVYGKRNGYGLDCRMPVNSAKPGDDDYQPHTEHDEYCADCDGVLPRLEQPRQYPGVCLPCVSAH